ncbi:hypothetical protein PRZ48_002343 [Zasmidium cellare]|uniref:Luciferase domain-containing protein n=1 Tax=Zasmidium cellare TaxID=395010 RepID=A0ABR0F4U7_ZASCE|nr:hypothetical protein PRZ48_002343 [Zasmidium cellare]
MPTSPTTTAIKTFTRVHARWSALPSNLRLLTTLSFTTLALLAARFWTNYRRWKALGAGGLPYNLKGYLMNLFVEWKFAEGDTVGLGVYERPEGRFEKWVEAGEGERSAVKNGRFLKDGLRERGGVRARAKTFVIPQREKSVGEVDAGDEKIRETYLHAFDALHETNSNTTEWRTSVLERRGKALFLKPNMPLRTLDQQTQREICHIHDSDLSGHVTLSLADAREVVAKGWGERHRLSGTKFLPLGYTMMYIPRSVEEVEVYRRIFQAGVDYLASAE